MEPKLKNELRKLILGELRKLLDEFRQVRSLRLSESGANSGYLAQRLEAARKKLDDLKHLQRRETIIQDRRKEIERSNDSKGRGVSPSHSPKPAPAATGNERRA